MKRTKENSKQWHDRMDKLLEVKPEYKNIKYIYDALFRLLQKDYPFIKEVEYEHVINFLKDTIYLDRQMRDLRVKEDRTAQKVDLKLVKLALEKELSTLTLVN